MAEKNNSLAKGSVLKSPEQNYKVEAVLGSGGFGITYMVLANVMYKTSCLHVLCGKGIFLSNCCERSEA